MDPQHALEHDIRRIEELNATRMAKLESDSASEEDDTDKEVSLNTIKATLGWKDGQRVGKARRAVTEGAIYRDLATPIQYLPRPELLGLGSKIERGAGLPQGDGDRPRHVMGIDEKIAVKKIGKGSRVTIKEGEHAGLTGIVIYFDRESVEISLDMSEERVLLPFESCQLADSIQQSGAERAQQEDSVEDLGEWLQVGLAVRFVSKTWRDGRYYSKRGTVEDTRLGLATKRANNIKLGTWLFESVPAEFRGDDLVFEYPGNFPKRPDFEWHPARHECRVRKLEATAKPRRGILAQRPTASLALFVHTGACRIALRHRTSSALAAQDRLASWVVRLETEVFRNPILRLDPAAAAEFGRLAARREKLGRRMEPMDAQIAGIAAPKAASIATRDILDFADLWIFKLINPFDAPAI